MSISSSELDSEQYNIDFPNPESLERRFISKDITWDEFKYEFAKRKGVDSEIFANIENIYTEESEGKCLATKTVSHSINGTNKSADNTTNKESVQPPPFTWFHRRACVSIQNNDKKASQSKDSEPKRSVKCFGTSCLIQ